MMTNCSCQRTCCSWSIDKRRLSRERPFCIRVISEWTGSPDPHFLEWGTKPPLYKYTSSLVPHFSDYSYPTAVLLAKMQIKLVSLTCNITKFWGVAPRPPVWGGARALPKLHLFDTDDLFSVTFLGPGLSSLLHWLRLAKSVM